MLEFTNKSNLPQAIVDALKNDPYNNQGSDFTATSLIKPVRIAKLEKLHAHEIQEDAEDMLYRLYGQVAHGILERANTIDLAEKRFFSIFKVNGKDYNVSAQLDTLSIKDGVLRDFKFTTSWGFKKGQHAKPEWEMQLNIQLELIRRNGLDAKEIQIIGLLRDWQINSAKNDPLYPQSPIATKPITIWPREQTVAYIEMRIADHTAEHLPECTEEERWTKRSTWAVVKKGGKRAINGGLQFSEASAIEVSNKTPGTEVIFRPGENIRCGSYCRASQFCDFYKRLKAIELTGNTEGESNV